MIAPLFRFGFCNSGPEKPELQGKNKTAHRGGIFLRENLLFTQKRSA